LSDKTRRAETRPGPSDAVTAEEVQLARFAPILENFFRSPTRKKKKIGSGKGKENRGEQTLSLFYQIS